MTAEADTKRGVLQRADGLEDRMESSDEEPELGGLSTRSWHTKQSAGSSAMPQEGTVPYASGERRVTSLSLASA